MNMRTKFILGLICTISLLVMGQIIRIQNSANTVAVLESDPGYSTVKVEPERGSIYDRWGSLLAGNARTYTVSVALHELTGPVNRETIARVAADILKEDYTDIAGRIADVVPETQPVYIHIGEGYSQAQIDQLASLKETYQNLPPAKRGQVNPSLIGMDWSPTLDRVYPENELASNILGFYYKGDATTKAGGVFGIEQYYNSLMSGTPQWITYVNSPNRAEEYPSVPPGASIILTIDREIQAMTEEALDRAVESSGSLGGAIVIMDPKTGEILAMAANPRIDPNNYGQFLTAFGEGGTINPAVSEPYETGSVFKVLTMAAAIDAGLVTPDTEYLDQGVYIAAGWPIYNWHRGPGGLQTMTGCMQHSLNVCLSHIAVDILGPSRFYSYIQAFGIDHRTGVDLADERTWPLLLPGGENWTVLSLANNSFGQGISATPVQMITAIGSLANDGKMMAPHLMKSYILDGRQYDFDPIVLGHPVSAETARTMTEMLAQSIENEANSAAVEGYRISGKTGTGEICKGAAGCNYPLTNASFVGWGPADDPRFIIYVWLKEPTSSPWGSVVAAPLFSEVAQKLTVYLDLPPDEVRQQLFNE